MCTGKWRYLYIFPCKVVKGVIFINGIDLLCLDMSKKHHMHEKARTRKEDRTDTDRNRRDNPDRVISLNSKYSPSDIRESGLTELWLI